MTTRLSKGSKDYSLTCLRGLLNNTVGFIDSPIQHAQRQQFIDMWNSKFPSELVQSVGTLGKYGMGIGVPAIQDRLVWVTVIGGQPCAARLKVVDLGPINLEALRAGVGQQPFGFFKAVEDLGREILIGAGPGSSQRIRALELSTEDLTQFLGADLTEEVISWMQNCALLKEKLILANTTLEDIFGMAQTAGQIKRMVPELLQYLPAEQRLAFEEQKRSSTVPFEWAPYPKANIEVMLAEINKGHLLQNMRKAHRADHTVETLDYVTWAHKCEFVKP